MKASSLFLRTAVLAALAGMGLGIGMGISEDHSLHSLRRAFHAINIYALLVMLLLIATPLSL